MVELDDPVEVRVEAWDDWLRSRLAHRAPALHGAPLASWVLARLAALTDEPLPADAAVELIDDAVFVRDMVVEEESGSPVAKLQIQGGMIGVGLLGVQNRSVGVRVTEALTAALGADPNELRPISVRVRDPDWDDAPQDYIPVPDPGRVNTYGWDGRAFLGADNVKIQTGR